MTSAHRCPWTCMQQPQKVNAVNLKLNYKKSPSYSISPQRFLAILLYYMKHYLHSWSVFFISLTSSKRRSHHFFFLVSYIYHSIDANAWLVNSTLKVSSEHWLTENIIVFPCHFQSFPLFFFFPLANVAHWNTHNDA